MRKQSLEEDLKAFRRCSGNLVEINMLENVAKLNCKPLIKFLLGLVSDYQNTRVSEGLVKSAFLGFTTASGIPISEYQVFIVSRSSSRRFLYTLKLTKHCTAIQSVIYRLAAIAPPGCLLEMQNLKLPHGYSGSDSIF